MKRIAIDSSVLWTIFKQQPGHDAWFAWLCKARREAMLVVNDVVVAETRPVSRSDGEHLTMLEDFGLHYVPTSVEAAMLAGEIHLAYRKQGGPRTRLLPDFLIGAHALLQADALAADDLGYIHKHFRELTILTP